MNLIQELEKEQLDKLRESKQIPDFAPGDTVRVNVKISEGTREEFKPMKALSLEDLVQVLMKASQ